MQLDAFRVPQEWRSPVTSVGLAMTATASCVAVLPGAEYVVLDPRGFTTAVVAMVAFNPWLVVVKTTDSLATNANATDYSESAQDGSTGTTLVLSSLATTGALWVGSDLPFRGMVVDVNATNTAAAVIAGVYWDGSTQTALSMTDGTASGGASLAVDGAITWTMPTDWTKAKLSVVGAAVDGVKYAGAELYWAKITWDAALDSAVTLNSVLALNRSTNYIGLPTGREFALPITRGPGGFGAIECRTDAGTGNLQISYGGRFTS